jgi:endo-1,4-beta-xylanase
VKRSAIVLLLCACGREGEATESNASTDDPTTASTSTDPTGTSGETTEGTAEARTVVASEHPLALDNTRPDPVIWPIWGGSFAAADPVRVRIDIASARGGAGLVFAAPGDEEPPARVLALRHADAGWTLEDRGGASAPMMVASEDAATIELVFAPGGASVEIAGGETITLDPPLVGADETIGTYAELDADAQIEITSLTVDEPHASSEDLGPSLRELAAARNITIGTATDVWPPIHDLPFEQLLGQQFDMAAPSEFYWTTTRSDGGFFFVPADTMVNYALVHDQRVRGYHLIWDLELPQWLLDISDTGDADGLAMALRDHVQTIVERYRGRVQEWVVVNEAIWGPEATGDPDVAEWSAESPWFDVLGPEYIEMSFIAAREVDPDAILLYNETGAEGIGAKSDFMYDMVADFVMRDIPIDGVGLQFHVDAATPPDPADLVANMQRFADLGVDVYITELDVNLIALQGTDVEKLEVQAQIFADIVGACLAVPECRSITTWGFTDRYAWYEREEGAEAPLMWTESYAPKPAFFAIQDALQSE